MGPAAASSTPAGGPNTCLYICTCIYIIIIQGGVMSCIVLRMRIKMKMMGVRIEISEIEIEIEIEP